MKNHIRNKIKHAFTLFELLLTTMVIGIIAAILIPQLYNSVEESILKTQFIRTYAIMLEGLKMASSEYQHTPFCYDFIYGGKYTEENILEDDELKEQAVSRAEQCDVFYKSLLKSFKIVKTCETNAYPHCIPKYVGYDEIWKNKNRHDEEFIQKVKESCPTCTEEELQAKISEQIEKYAELYRVKEHPLSTSNIKKSRSAHVLADGQIIIEFGTNGSNVKHFAVDINGTREPNMWGYDLFSFHIVGNPSIPLTLIDGGKEYIELGGKTTAEKIKEIMQKDSNQKDKKTKETKKI